MLTIEQYEQVLQQMGPKRKWILKKLYFHGPFVDSNVIARTLGFKGYGETNLNIGTIGKYISEVSGIEPTYYYPRSGVMRPAYFSFVHDDTGGEWDMVPNLRKAIENLKWDMTDEDFEPLLTEETQITRTMFRDGKLTQVWVNRYERDLKARKAAEKLHGKKCLGCELDFKKMYGDDIKDIIHFHHIRPLAKVKKEEEKDVAKDLVPLCPNCHSVVHSTEKLMTIKELQKRVQKAKNIKGK